jgi:hypothetical protein
MQNAEEYGRTNYSGRLPMSLVFAEEKCSKALLDFLSCTDVGRISGVVEEVENSDHEESSDGGV